MSYAALVALVIFGTLLWRVWQRRKNRAELLKAPLHDGEWEMITADVSLLKRLPRELRPKLEGKINLFLDQVTFIGCDGLEVTEEMELSIAAQAALLVVNTDAWYENLNDVLIYPGAFKSRQQRRQGYVVTEEEIVRSGESWLRGPVILSWQHSASGAADDSDGHNVVLHEFAHQLDDLSGRTNGVPLLGAGQSFAEWETAILSAFERHVENTEAGRRTVIDPYGATGHEEFFAVAVEAFFETPQTLQDQEPAVYEQLAKLFALDPAEWRQAD